MKKLIALLLLLALLLTACVPAAEVAPEESAPTGGYRETVIIKNNWVSSQLSAFPDGAGFVYIGSAISTEDPYDYGYIWYQLQDGAVVSCHEIPFGGSFAEYTITTEYGEVDPSFSGYYGTRYFPQDGCLVGGFGYQTGTDYAYHGFGINIFDPSSTSANEPAQRWLFEDIAASLFSERKDPGVCNPVFMMDSKMLWTYLQAQNSIDTILLSKTDLVLLDTKTGSQTIYPDIGINLSADNCQLFEDTIFVHSGDTVTAYDALTGAESPNFSKTQIGNGSSEHGIYSDKPVKFCGADSEAVYYLDAQGLNRKVHGGAVSEILLDASYCLLSSDKWSVTDVAMVDAHEFYVEYGVSSTYWGSSTSDSIVVSYVWDDNISIDQAASITVASLDFGALIEVAREELRRFYPNISIKAADIGPVEYPYPIGGDYNSSELYPRNVVDSPDETKELMEALRKGSGPDIILWDANTVKQLAEEGLLMDMQGLLEVPDMPAVLWNAFSQDGSIPALPLAVMIPGVMAEAEDAARWQSILSIADDISDEKNPYTIDDVRTVDALIGTWDPLVLYDLFMRSDWGSIITENGLDTARYRTLLKFVSALQEDFNSAAAALGVDLTNHYSFSRSIVKTEERAVIFQQPQRLFLEGYRVSFTLPRCYPTYLDLNRYYYQDAFAGGVYLSEEYALQQPAFMCGGLFSENSVQVPFAVAISANADDPEACARFVEALLSKEAQTMWNNGYCPYMPVIPSVLDVTLLKDRSGDPDVHVTYEEALTREKLLSLGIPELYSNFDEVQIVDFFLLQELRNDALRYLEGDLSLDATIQSAARIVSEHRNN